MADGDRRIEVILALQALRLEVTKPARWTGSLPALQTDVAAATRGGSVVRVDRNRVAKKYRL